ncbi:prepilin-type N-terminal cleavage/methylation domain-containing protein [Pseudomonas sp. 3A(2025)]
MSYRSRGFGLVEIMVALVLGLVVSMGIIQIFSASRGTFQSQNAAARMQEDARFVLSKMIQELRMTGMYGCLSLSSYVPITPAIALPSVLDRPIFWDSTTSTLTLVTADIGSTGTVPTWTIISDCQTSSQLYSGARTPAAGQTAFALRQVEYSFSNGTLFIGPVSNRQPLLQNVSNMGVLFGMAGNPMTYTDTITAANAGNIRSVRLTVTLRDPDGRVEDQPYSVVAYLRNRF